MYTLPEVGARRGSRGEPKGPLERTERRIRKKIVFYTSEARNLLKIKDDSF